ncbi:MAG: hypothetical protein JEY99_16560 [Spirochaetales bacterium]|nr:hypothetical protein [Spirochaetales bacterium]
MEYSPILALLTGSLEIGAATYFLLKIGQKKESFRVIIAILFLLAGYQILEAFNCSRIFNGSLTRLAFADITWLPALGVYYISRQQEKAAPRIISYFYLGTASVFSIWYLFITQSLALSHCQNVIAVYTNNQPVYLLYSIYYQSGLLMMILIPSFIRSTIEDPKRQMNLRDFQIGTLAFMIPSIGFVLYSELLAKAMPSVMCHFALLLAIFLVRILYRENYEALQEEIQTA